MDKKLILFGAGKIGRSFIGQIFARSNYEVVFIDVIKPLIDELNKKRCYKVIFRSGEDQVLLIKNVRGVYLYNEAEVAEEIASAEIAAVSVISKQNMVGSSPIWSCSIRKALNSSFAIDWPDRLMEQRPSFSLSILLFRK